MTITQDVTKDATEVKNWLLLHERLIITILVLAATLFIGNKILDYQAKKDKAASDAAAQTLAAQQETNKSLAAQVAQTASQYQALVVQLSQQNAQLAASIQSRTVVLQTQQTADKTIPLPDLGKRWESLANLSPSDLTATPDSVSITPEGARTTVQQLEEVPVLQQNLADSQTQNSNLKEELDSSTKLGSLLQTQVDNLNVTITDQDKACKTEVATVKAEARKSKLHLFGIGYGLGFISGLVVDHIKF